MTATSEDRALTLMREAFAPISEPAPGNEDEVHAMRALGRVLTSDAEIRIRPPKPPRGGHRARAHFPRTAAIALPATAAVVAAIVIAVTLLSTSPTALAQKFPVFATSPATPARAALAVFRESNVRVSSSRAVHTSEGTGYVSVSTSNDEICIAAPASLAELLTVSQANAQSSGSASHLGYVGGCTLVRQAEKKGVLLTLPAHGRVELLLVLPTGTSETVVRSSNGRATKLHSKDGMIVTLVRAPAALEYRVGRTRISEAIEQKAAKRPTVVAPYER